MRDLFDRLSDAFATAITNGQLDGDIGPDLDPQDTGQLLVGIMQGAVVLARAGTSKTKLTAYMDSALTILD